MVSSWLITGASRGIGLSMVENLLNDENNFVIATARNPSSSEGLKALSEKYPSSRLALVKLDVTKSDDIAKAVETITPLLPNGLDHFISNAGVFPQPLATFDELDLDELLHELKFNTVSIIEVTRALLPFIRKSEKKKIIFISSILGSISVGGVWPGVANAYAISKASLNMLVRKWGSVLKMEGIAVSIVHPGWVATDLGDGVKPWMEKYNPDAAQIPSEEAAAGILKITNNLTLEDTTSFYSYDGTTIGW
ncbi:hypothetical protein D9611_006578 [Ephemerocybe angulata]|uniref:Uncharacterized protein n=2 Tax=Ephemerocybe angulata TaxID=980116 RepID=A0A8H5C910_9AGAR|nr:hypothetical protein D9611_006578 [Tulosesus angulatus]KAF6756312.1 hypothetical protein DFP72DRAFT_1044902 [Tulosesus angulatus]